MIGTQFQERDLPSHGESAAKAILLACVPMWLMLLVTGFVLKSLLWSLLALALILPPTIFWIFQKTFRMECPECGNMLKVKPWQTPANEMHLFRCEKCRIIWKTYIFQKGYY